MTPSELAFFKEILSIDSTTGNERALSDFLAARFVAMGATVATLAPRGAVQGVDAPQNVSSAAACEETVLSGTRAKKRHSLKGLWVTLWVAAAIAVVALAALAVIGRTKPELIDKYLYTAEELELVNL